MLSEPTPRRDGGTRSETEEVAVGGGPGGGVRFGVFRVLGLVDDRTGDWLHFPPVLEFLAMSGMDVGRDSLSPISTRYEDHSRSAVSWPASGSRWTM